MKILVVLLLCGQAFSLPANQAVQTQQDVLQKVLAANPLENDIRIGLEEITNAKENENGVNNPAQVVQMLQKVLQKEETPPTTEQDLVTTQPDYEVNSEPQTELPLEISDSEVSIQGTESSILPNTEGDKYSVTADVGIITFDPTIEVTEEKPKSEATEQVLPSVQDETQYTTPEESVQLLSEGDNAEKLLDGTEDKTETISQIQEKIAVPIESTAKIENFPVVPDTPTEQSPDLTTGYPDEQEPLSKYNPIVFPDDAQPKLSENVLPNEGTAEKKDNFSQQSDVPKMTDIKSSQLTPLDTAKIESNVDETTDSYVQIPDGENPIVSPFDTLPLDPTLENIPEDSYVQIPDEENPIVSPFDTLPLDPTLENIPEDSYVQIPDEENPIVSPFDTLPLDPTLENIPKDSYVQIPDEENPIVSPFDTLPLDPTLENVPEENPDSYVETPLEYSPQDTLIDDLPMEENPDFQIPLEDYPVDMVPEEQPIDEIPVEETPGFLIEDPIEDSSLIIPIDSSPAPEGIFEPEPAEQDVNLFAEDPLEGSPPVRTLEMVPTKELIGSILAEENPLLSPIDTLPLEPFYEETLTEENPENPEIPFLEESEQEPIPQDMAIVPSENIPEDVLEPMPIEPEDPQSIKESLTPPIIEDDSLISPVMEPGFDESNPEMEANFPEIIQGNQDIMPDAAINTNYPVPSMNETPESGLFGLNPSRPIDDYPASPSFDANQENTPYEPIKGIDENFVSGQFYPNSNAGSGGHFQYPQHPPGLDEISDSFEYNPYEQVPFISSQIEHHYNPHWGFPDIYEAPKYGKRPSFNPGDRYIGNKYFDRGTYDSFPGNWGANREFYGYNQQQRGPALKEAKIPVREMAVNTGGNSGVNSFIPDGGRPLFTAEGDNFQMQYERDPMDTIPSHKFVPMVGMPPINRHHPISESMTPYEETGTIPFNTKEQSLQLPILNYKNEMQPPVERYNAKYNSYDNPQDPNYKTFYVVDSNIPQNSQDLPFMQIDKQNQVVPNKEQKFTETQITGKDPKPTNLVQGTELPMETNQGFGNLYYPAGERVPEISPSTYTGSFEPQYFNDAYMPNSYQQKAQSGPYLEDTYTSFDNSPYYNGGMGYHKPHYNYRDEFYY